MLGISCTEDVGLSFVHFCCGIDLYGARFAVLAYEKMHNNCAHTRGFCSEGEKSGVEQTCSKGDTGVSIGIVGETVSGRRVDAGM